MVIKYTTNKFQFKYAEIIYKVVISFVNSKVQISQIVLHGHLWAVCVASSQYFWKTCGWELKKMKITL